jgi:hypothetical protein
MNFAMQRFRTFFIPAVTSLVVLALVGCNNPDARYARVEGTVTYNQQPVEGAIVTFAPASAGAGEAASGSTDAAGRFALTSGGAVTAGSGVLPGEYIVLVSKVYTPACPDYEDLRHQRITLAEYEARMSRGNRDNRPPPQSLIPIRYSDRNQTDLRATVEQGKMQSFEFNLTD